MGDVIPFSKYYKKRQENVILFSDLLKGDTEVDVDYLLSNADRIIMDTLDYEEEDDD